MITPSFNLACYNFDHQRVFGETEIYNCFLFNRQIDLNFPTGDMGDLYAVMSQLEPKGTARLVRIRGAFFNVPFVMLLSTVTTKTALCMQIYMMVGMIDW